MNSTSFSVKSIHWQGRAGARFSRASEIYLGLNGLFAAFVARSGQRFSRVRLDRGACDFPISPGTGDFGNEKKCIFVTVINPRERSIHLSNELSKWLCEWRHHRSLCPRRRRFSAAFSGPARNRTRRSGDERTARKDPVVWKEFPENGGKPLIIRAFSIGYRACVLGDDLAPTSYISPAVPAVSDVPQFPKSDKRSEKNGGKSSVTGEGRRALEISSTLHRPLVTRDNGRVVSRARSPPWGAALRVVRPTCPAKMSSRRSIRAESTFGYQVLLTTWQSRKPRFPFTSPSSRKHIHNGNPTDRLTSKFWG